MTSFIYKLSPDVESPLACYICQAIKAKGLNEAQFIERRQLSFERRRPVVFSMMRKYNVT